jgi:hypothetical protein
MQPYPCQFYAAKGLISRPNGWFKLWKWFYELRLSWLLGG